MPAPRPPRRGPGPALLLFLLALLLAGCAGPPSRPAEQPAPDVLDIEGLSVEPANFTGLDAPWLVRTTSGCGACLGVGGYEVPGEHHALLVLQDLRAVRVEFSVRPDSAGFHVFPNITLPAARLEALLGGLARASDGEVWVSRVALARIGGPAAPRLGATLAARWAAPQATPCADCGSVDAWLNASGDVRHAKVVGRLGEQDPFLGVLGLTGALELAVQQRGAPQGATLGDAGAAVEGRSLRPAFLQGCRPGSAPAETSLLRDAAAFRAAWSARCGNATAPDVDFSNATVVSAWRDPSAAYALGVASATQEGDHARVVLLRVHPGLGCGPDASASPGSFTAVDGAWPSARYEVLDRASPPC